MKNVKNGTIEGKNVYTTRCTNPRRVLYFSSVAKLVHLEGSDFADHTRFDTTNL